LPRGGQRHPTEVGGGDAGERTRALAQVAHLRARQAAVSTAIRPNVTNADETSGVRIRRLGEHAAVEDAEERRVRAHAERQGEDGHRREPR
jgi:hypothetical protein